MIAVVHGPIGCGKSTALRGWMERRGWAGGKTRGWRTFIAGEKLRLASWDGRIDVAVGERTGGGGGRGRAVEYDAGYGAGLADFLDGVFGGGGKGWRVWPPPAAARGTGGTGAEGLPWRVDGERFRGAALECLEGDGGWPVAIDELGVLETAPGALAESAAGRVGEVLGRTAEAGRGVVVVQERGWGFWSRVLGVG